MAAVADFEGRSLLAVFAHPDDESLSCGGLLAWCAARGARVSLLCATRGEQGRGAGDEALARIRTAELHDAARVLGVSEVLVLDYPDGELQWIDDSSRAGELAADILNALRLISPDVVVTFGEDGLYWHPDHVAIHEQTTAAVTALGDAAPALFYVTMPSGAIRTVVETVAATLPDGDAHRDVFGIDPDAFGTLAQPPTLVVDVGNFAATKVAALRRHGSQLGDGALAALPEADTARLLRFEHFRRAALRSTRDPFIERLASAH
jgi:N-acetyl-1-D-myo-inositol-2-amino-2-deoxy-alpha-D-glucopyranoside deacetylase